MRYAIVQRVLPDEIIIKVVEREPIGLARIDGEIYQFDVDGNDSRTGSEPLTELSDSGWTAARTIMNGNLQKVADLSEGAGRARADGVV